ncbi:MAG TPA: hypothetical protein VGR00_12525, partial [Thermoanaerobaculia bacterium]|nr:hypothetical protein [Thermoanaerobaculia bacterium]
VDSQAQTTYAVYGATIPLSGPGPVLSLDGFAPPSSGTSGAFMVRVRNDGTAAATGLLATLTVDGNQILAPTIVVPFPDVPPCHGLAELAIAVPFAVSTPYVSAVLHLSGAAGTAALPFSFPKPQGGTLGTLLTGTFESGATGDFAADPDSLWHVSSTCAALGAGHGGSGVAYFGLDSTCTYDFGTPMPARVFGGLVSKKVSLAPGGARLNFEEWVGRSAFWSADFMGAQISTDGGLSFENLWGYGRMSRFTPDPAVPLADGSGRPTWHRVSLDLSDYGGHEVVLRFFVNATTRPSGGYAVDDVALVQTSNVASGGAGTCAEPVDVGAGAVEPLLLALDDEGATASPGEPAPPCAPATSHPFWLRVTPPETGDLALSVCGQGFSGAVAVFDGASCPASSAAPAACASFGACGATPPVPVVVRGTRGRPLRILVTAEATSRGGILSFGLTPRFTSRVVPVVLDVVSTFGAYTTEVTLTNRSASEASVTLTYTASLGSGSGNATFAVGAGRSLVLPDVLAALRGKGVPIPPSSVESQAGTLDVAFEGVPAGAVSATARTLSPTKAPLPEGRASLAYPGVAPRATASVLVVAGLRTTALDRSKVAVYSATTEPLTLRITAYDGDGSKRSGTVASALSIPPLGWLQIEDPLAVAGSTNGWVVVERLAGDGAFGAYGIVNDNVTNDGSFLPAESASAASVSGVVSRMTVPVLVETDRFTSELVLTNRSSRTATVTLSYRESLNAAGGAGSFSLDLEGGRQLLLPDAVEWLRSKGVAIGAKGPGHAGALRISVTNGLASDIFAGVRAAAPTAKGGEFGLFLPAVRSGAEAGSSAALDGLFADAENRSNVAVVNAGDDGSGPVTLRLQAYDGATGAAAGKPLDVTLPPGG